MGYKFAMLSVISGIIPVLAALFNYKQIDKVLKIAATFFLVSFLFDVGFWIALETGGGNLNDMPFVHLYLLVSLGFYSVIYYYLILNMTLKRIVIILSIMTLITFLYNALKLLSYPTISNTALSILLIILSLVYFYQLLNRQEYVYIEKQGWFWINAGILFYSAVNIFLFMLFNQIPKDLRANILIIHSVTNIIANILYSVGLFCKPQKTT